MRKMVEKRYQRWVRSGGREGLFLEKRCSFCFGRPRLALRLRFIPVSRGYCGWRFFFFRCACGLRGYPSNVMRVFAVLQIVLKMGSFISSENRDISLRTAPVAPHYHLTPNLHFSSFSRHLVGAQLTDFASLTSGQMQLYSFPPAHSKMTRAHVFRAPVSSHRLEPVLFLRRRLSNHEKLLLNFSTALRVKKQDSAQRTPLQRLRRSFARLPSPRSYHSDDPLDLGEALWLAHWSGDREAWSRTISGRSVQTLEQLWQLGYFRQPPALRLAFREFGATIGVQV